MGVTCAMVMQLYVVLLWLLVIVIISEVRLILHCIFCSCLYGCPAFLDIPLHVEQICPCLNQSWRKGSRVPKIDAKIFCVTWPTSRFLRWKGHSHTVCIPYSICIWYQKSTTKWHRILKFGTELLRSNFLLLFMPPVTEARSALHLLNSWLCCLQT